MDEYYFLPEDFAALDRQIREIFVKIREIGQEIGASCNEGAETYHDKKDIVVSKILRRVLLNRRQLRFPALVSPARL